jgi:valyl-tRNA synthetase
MRRFPFPLAAFNLWRNGDGIANEYMDKELPKTYEPSLYEDDIYKKWEDSGYFNPDNFLVGKDAGAYCIVMPPPNVTGTLHAGHAAMLSIEDILIRYHRMSGYRTLWLPGTDHAAIATQTKVEKIIKAEGTDRHKLGRENFLKRVSQFAGDSHDTIVNQVKKLGCSCDWSREAYTLDAVRTKAVRSVFKMMHGDGLIYRGERVVNWCPRCHSTLADDEVEYKEQQSKLYTFKYSADFPFMIATTRPETKLGDTAVAVNPKDGRYKEYIGKVYEVDFVGVPLKIMVIADRNVDMEFGTGALGVTPAHSFVDWQMAEKNGLNIIKVIAEDGKIRAGFGEYAGRDVYEAREMIVAKLKERGLMSEEQDIDNKLSLCYRCDTPIEPLPSLQWFIDVNKKIPALGKSIIELSIEAVRSGVFGRDKIRIVPERFEKQYFNWMENLRDWCISRQIWFGHQIPVWYRGDEIYVGIEAPAGEGWEQDEDTLDTWFSSGLWTFSTLADSPGQISIQEGKLNIDSDDFRNFHPTAVLETGYDILFFWVARMILMTTYAAHDIPFRDVYLHGLVLDEKGKKMSKSKGNVLDPLDMKNKYGADAARLSLIMNATPGNDMKISEEKIQGQRNFINKLWNISRYIITNYEIKIKNYELRFDDFTAADAWIVAKMQLLVAQITDDLNAYKFSSAGDQLRNFIWNDLADWYLEICKFEKNQEKRDILSFLLSNILKLAHPFIPFVTEKIWELAGEKDLIISNWPLGAEIVQTPMDFDIIKDIIIAIRNARSENKIEPARKVKAMIYARDKKASIESQELLIRSLRTGIDDLEIKASGEKIDNTIYITAGDIEIYLIAAIDTEKEKARIGKEIINLEKLIKSLSERLSNPEFVSKAPAKIVETEKKKLFDWKGELERLYAQVKKL